jgi:NADH-quinone oxidoreductase subunit N
VSAVSLGRSSPFEGCNGAVILDDLAYGLVLPCAVAGLLTVLLCLRYILSLKRCAAELPALLALATSGMAIMVQAQDLVVGFFGMEILSVAAYILAAYARERRASNEAGLKYLLVGSLGSAIMLYGIALLYASFGTTSLPRIAMGEIAPAVKAAGDPYSSALPAVGLVLIAAGLAFKAAIAPFHMWCPDVYQGAPTPVTAFFSVGPKIAALGFLYRVLVDGMPGAATNWVVPVAVMAAVSMTVGNLGALLQGEAKRMLAYSGIAHAGYMLMAIVAAGAMRTALPGTPVGAGGALVLYACAYAVTNIGAFGAVSLLCRDDRDPVDLERCRGLAGAHPWAAGALALFMVSLTGLPITAGFWGKWALFIVTVQSGLVWLAIVAALNAAVSAYYYLRPVALAFLAEPQSEDGTIPGTWFPTKGALWVILGAVLGVAALAIYPAIVATTAHVVVNPPVP